MSDDAPNPTADAPAGSDSPDGPTKPAPKQRGFLGKIWHDWVKPLGLVILIVTALRSSLVDWNDVPSGSMRPTILEGDRIVVNKLAYGFNVPFNGPKIDLPLLPTFDNPLDFGPRFLWSQPRRGDIVTFWNPTPDQLPDPRDPGGETLRDNPSSGIRMVKRVVGVPGDTVWVEDGRLRIVDKDGNEVPITYEPFADGPYKAEPTGAYNPATRQADPKRDLPVAFFLEDLGGVTHFMQLIQAYGGWVPQGHRYRNLGGDDGQGVTLLDSDNLAECEYFMVGDNRDNSLDSRYYQADLGIKVTGAQITGKAKFIAVSFDGSWLNPAFGRWFRSFDGAAEAAGRRRRGAKPPATAGRDG